MRIWGSDDLRIIWGSPAGHHLRWTTLCCEIPVGGTAVCDTFAKTYLLINCGTVAVIVRIMRPRALFRWLIHTLDWLPHPILRNITDCRYSLVPNHPTHSTVKIDLIIPKRSKIPIKRRRTEQSQSDERDGGSSDLSVERSLNQRGG